MRRKSKLELLKIPIVDRRSGAQRTGAMDFPRRPKVFGAEGFIGSLLVAVRCIRGLEFTKRNEYVAYLVLLAAPICARVAELAKWLLLVLAFS
jgi:hypothetical protein